ncbi:MAG: AtpZ/AtpI family protein [Candidatus Aminicenantes bacterium]|nr:MAG: AtpZ/AtpI family protein [Candidatus Aminicenantes bacterium]
MTDEKPRHRDLRRLAELSSIGLILPSSIAVGLFLGYFLDRWLGTAPWLLLSLTVLGIVSGLLSLFRALRKELKNEPPEDRPAK